MENIASSIAVAVIAAFTTFQLSIRQFRSERWWELKVSAYQKILEALHYSKKFLDYHYDAELLRKETGEKNEYEAALRKKSSEAGEEILKAADIGAFLLSDEASARLKLYREESKKASEQDSWFEYLDYDLFATSKCLDDLIVLARKDLDEGHASRLKGYCLQLSRLVKKLMKRDDKAK